MLPVALEKATRILQVFLTAGKEYVCVLRLHGAPDLKRVKETIHEFVGEIYQRPPLRSSVKRRLRTRKIYFIKVLEVSPPYVLMRIGCEAGTYIRKLCYDIGEVIGTGAHMEELRRTRTGPFVEDSAVDLYELVDAFARWREEGDESGVRKVVRPLEEALDLLPKAVVRDSAVDAICHGAHLAVPGIVAVSSGVSRGDLVAITTLKGEAVALGEAVMSTEEILDADRGIAVLTRRVVMEPGTYPRMWKSKR